VRNIEKFGEILRGIKITKESKNMIGKIKRVKFFWIFIIAIISCKNKDNKDASSLNAPCDQLPVPVNYSANTERYRTIDFEEDKETFRIVSDTTENKFKVYLQIKIKKDCWKTLEDTFQCRQEGIKLIDLNDDGYIDLHNQWRWWTDVHLYIPENKTFTEKIEIGGLLTKLSKNVQHDWKSYPRSDSSESRLFRFENSDIKISAKIKIWYKLDPEGYTKDDKIELFKVNHKLETLIKTWTLKDLPTFTKNNGDYDYIDTEAFVNDYWENNWQLFIEK
jgi:hypothetical protein